MAKQIKRTQKFLLYALSGFIGLFAVAVSFHKEKSVEPKLDDFKISNYFTNTARADTPSSCSSCGSCGDSSCGDSSCGDGSCGDSSCGDSSCGDGGDSGSDSSCADGNCGGASNGGGGGADGDACQDGSNDGYCFPAGTKVTLADESLVSIESLKRGMKLKGDNENVYEVASLIVHDGVNAMFDPDPQNTGEPYVKITCDNGTVLTSVTGHPVLVNNGQGWEWSNFGELKVGSKLKTEAGEVAITTLELSYAKLYTTLYNVELDVNPGESRSFYANGILVRDTQWIDVPINAWLNPQRVRSILSTLT